MPELTQKQILVDLHERLRALEGQVECMSARAHMEALERARWLATQRRLVEHCERLVRAKETLLAAIGSMTVERQGGGEIAAALYEPADLEYIKGMIAGRANGH